MSLLSPGGVNCIGVRDLPSATKWYTEKLGLRTVQIELDEPEGCVALGFDKRECAIVLGPIDRAANELIPLLYTRNIQKAHEFLAGRGISVSEIQQDRQGTHFFEMRDIEGNAIEISEEPS